MSKPNIICSGTNLVFVCCSVPKLSTIYEFHNFGDLDLDTTIILKYIISDHDCSTIMLMITITASTCPNQFSMRHDE